MSTLGAIQDLIRDVAQEQKAPVSEIYVIDPIMGDLRRELGKPEPEPIVVREVKILPMSAYPAEVKNG